MGLFVILLSFVPVLAITSTGLMVVNSDLAYAVDPENPRQADGSEADIQVQANSCNLNGDGLSLPTWYQYLPTQKVNGECEIKTDGLGGKVVILILMGIFDILLYVAGLVAVVMIIWGGFKLLTSDGEPQKIAAARTTIFNALVGLIIAVIASQIVGFIAGGLT